MAHIAKYDDLTLYNTWVAYGRNASQAGRSLGMEPAAYQWHVRTKNFEQKYLMEYGGLAEGTMRAGVVKAMLSVPEVIEELLNIIRTDPHVTDPETGQMVTDPRLLMAKVKAIDSFVKYLPQIPEKFSDWEDTTVEVRGEVAQQIDPEQEIILALESNIIDANEQRSRTKR